MVDLSIIVPVYNVEKYLDKCISSVLEQDYDNYELILVDDGSTDSSPLICDSYAEKNSAIKVIHKKNSGPSAARNEGIKIATGKYVWFVDGDDFTINGSMAAIAKLFDFGYDIMRFSAVSVFGDNNTLLEKNKFVPFFEGDAEKEKICELAQSACSSRLFVYPWRNIYSISFLRENNILFNEAISFGEDSAFNAEAFLKANKMLFKEWHIYAYRQRSDSLSKKNDEYFNMKNLDSLMLYNQVRDECYDKFCEYKSDKYYEDAGKFVLNSIYLFNLVKRLYSSKSSKKFKLFKTISKSKMIRDSFARFDINIIKSKSLDWYILWASKNKLYFPAHLLCKYFVFK